MRLRTLRVRNYRVHRDCVVEFDASRTLIGGPNESGKSTLVEALQRAFFLKAKGNTEYHRAMLSDHGGEPEVDVIFQTGGVDYEIKKRFGARGTTTLLAAGRSGLAGDEAEAKIAELLAIREPVTGKAMPGQWGHLWVRQGTSGDNPAGEATAQSGPLIRRLQEMGGAAALQSDLDAALARRFRDEADAIFRKNGEAKAGSDWEIAATEASAAAERLRIATARIEASRVAVTDLEAAERASAAAERSLVELRRERDAAGVRADRVEALRRTEDHEARGLAESEKSLGSLRMDDGRIAELTSELARREAALEPLTAEVARLRTAATDAKSLLSRSTDAAAIAGESLRSARRRRDFLAAGLAVRERAAVVQELTGQLATVGKARDQLATLRDDLARLPALTEAKWKELRASEDDVNRSQAALDATAAGLEVLASDASIVANGKNLLAGERIVLTDAAEVTIGAGVRLRVQPGGGTSLSTARTKLEESRRALGACLRAIGIDGIEQAEAALASRRLLATRIEAAEASLRDGKADETPARLAAAREALAASEAERDRRRDNSTKDIDPSRENLAEAERSLAEAELADAEARGTLEGDARTAAAADSRATQQSETIERERRVVGDLRAQLKLLEDTHGDAAARARRLGESEAMRGAAEKALTATRASLSALDAAHLSADLERLARATETTTAALNEARTRIAVARSALRSDGSEDPAADLANAVARHDIATVRLDSARRRAEATRLLDGLFAEEQRSLADQFAEPLASTISDYLECLFGTGARATVVLHENEFSGLELTRANGDGGAFAFDSLSGGAREQFAAAVRLAVAEVLAAEFDGTLPIIFDDAFAYADPARVRTLQRMLDRAAGRGLQVIVLTCDPEDYARLGAAFVAL